jgi:hypothetical protein
MLRFMTLVCTLEELDVLCSDTADSILEVFGARPVPNPIEVSTFYKQDPAIGQEVLLGNCMR